MSALVCTVGKGWGRAEQDAALVDAGSGRLVQGAVDAAPLRWAVLGHEGQHGLV